MKKFFRWLPALLICTAMSMACSDDEPTPGSGPVDPVDPTENQVLAKTSEGADITLISKGTDKFEWQITPRSECLSYRVDVKIRARMVEDHRMAMRTEPDLSYEQFIQDRMFATDGTGAGAWVGAVDGESEARDFSTDMTIFQGVMIPDMEYIIMVWGCRNNTGGSPAEYTEMTVRTNKVSELIGNPEVKLDVITNTRYSQVTYTPNEDCAAYFWWELPAADFDEFFENGGTDEQLGDICISYVYEYATEAYTNIRDLLAWKDKDTRTAVVAIAMDGNLTRNPTQFYAEYELKKPDPNVPDPEYHFEFVKCSALVVRFDVELGNETTMNAYYCLNPNETGQLPKNETDLVVNGGWIVPREDPHQWQYTSPDTDYRILITARNNQSILLPMADLELCHTKPLGNFDLPKDKMKWEKVSDDDKTKFKMEFYPDEDISCFFFCTLLKGSCYYDPVLGQVTDIDLTDPKNVETMRKYMINNANVASPLIGAREAWGDFTYTGLEPGKEYTTFVLAEDWDGNFVDVQYLDVSMLANPGGPNPVVEFGEGSVDTENMVWNLDIIPNADVYSLRYCCSEESAASVRIDDYDFEVTPDEQKLQAWTEYILGDVALKNHGTKTSIFNARISDNMLTLAIGIGKKDGADVYSNLAVMRLDYDTKKYEQLTLGQKAQETIAKVVAEHFKAQKPARVAAKPLSGFGGNSSRVIIRN